MKRHFQGAWRLGAALALLVLGWGMEAEASVRCDRCRKFLNSGVYYTTTGEYKILCPDCMKYMTPAACKVCGLDMPNQGAAVKGAYGYCTNCAKLLSAALAERCIVCQGVLDQRIAVDGAMACSPACATKYRLDKVGERKLAGLACATCGKSLVQNGGGGIRVFNGQLACSDACVEAMFPKCSVCGRKTPSLRRVGGKVVCSDRCAAMQLPKCIICNQPFSPGGNEVVCVNCAKTAVTSQAEAENLLKFTQGEVSWVFGTPLGCTPRLVLADHDTMIAQSPPTDTNVTHRGLYSSTRGIDPATGERAVRGCTIYVLRDLPREHLRDTMAHESTHHWLAHHAPVSLGDREEGFCEYIATIVSLHHGNSAIANEKILNTLSPYRDGLMWWIQKVGQPPRSPAKGVGAPWLAVPAE